MWRYTRTEEFQVAFLHQLYAHCGPTINAVIAGYLTFHSFITKHQDSSVKLQLQAVTATTAMGKAWTDLQAGYLQHLRNTDVIKQDSIG